MDIGVSNSYNMRPTNFSIRLIDNKVFFFLGIVSLVFLIIFSFRVKQFEPCFEPEISVKMGELYVGEIIQFKIQGKDFKIGLEWDFGDGTPAKNMGSSVGHLYSKPGRYQVSVKHSNKCMGFSIVNVEIPPVLKSATTQVEFSGPETIQVGAPATFVDKTQNASSWEWRFGESNKVDANTQKAVYAFKNAGSKKVILVVDGIYSESKIVLVTEKPISKPNAKVDTPVPVKPAPKIEKASMPNSVEPQSRGENIKEIAELPKVPDNETIRRFLMDLASNGQSSINLSKFFCDPNDLRFIYRGEPLSVAQLDRELNRVRRSRRIENLGIQTNRGGENNCVNVLQISLDR